MLPVLGKIHLLLADTQVLPDAKPGLSHKGSISLHLLPHSEDVPFFHTRRRDACRRVNRVIVVPDKFCENVDISESIL